MASEDQHAPAGTPPAPPRRRPWLAIVLFTLAALMLSASLAILWMFATESGTRALLSLLGRELPLQASGVRGALADELQVERLQLQAGDRRIVLEGVRLRWQPWQLRERQLVIDQMRVRSMTVLLQPGKDEPAKLPESLALPFRLSLRSLEVTTLAVRREDELLLRAADVALSLHYDGQQHRLQLHKMRVLPQGAAAISGQLSGTLAIASARPFALDARLQLAGRHAEGSASGTLQLDGDLAQTASRFALELLRDGRRADLNGRLSLRPFDAQPFAGGELHARALDLAMLSPRWPATRIDADLAMRSADRGSFVLHNRQPGPLARARLPLARASGEFTLSDDAVKLDTLSINRGEFVGSARLRRATDGREFSVRGRLRGLRVSDWRPMPALPPIVLTGSIALDGQLAPRPRGELSFALDDSRVGERSLNGQGELALEASALRIRQLMLRIGANQLKADGALDLAGGDLRFALEAPQLAQLGAGLAGSATLDGELSGSFVAPKLNARWRAESLRAPGGIAAAQLEGSIVASQSLSAPLQLALDGRRLNIGDTSLERVQVNVDGSFAAHALQLQLATARERLALSARGGIDALHADARWRGSVERFATDGRLRVQSNTPASLSFDRRSFALSGLQLTGELGTLVVEHLSRDAQRLASRGRIDALPVAPLLQHVRQDAVASTDLVLAGRWDFVLPADGDPRGSVQLSRRRGDLVLSGAQQIALGLSTLALDVRAVGERIALTLEAQGKQLGTIAFGGTVGSGGRQPPGPEATIDGVLSLALPSVAAVSALLSPNVLANGRLDGRIFVTGTIADPALSGQLAGSDLRVLLADSGFTLDDGKLKASLSGNTVDLSELSFAGVNGQGRVALRGPVRFSDGHASGKLDWRLERFLVFDRVDRRLQVSGDGQLLLSEARADLRGKVTVERGFFDIGRADAPELSDDVVVAGAPPPEPRALGLGLDVSVTLGDQLRLLGRGLDARIGGTVQLTSAPGEPLSANGEVRVVRGTYRAYGRELAIERGVLRFDGPAANPALDIRAMRRGGEVAAGVSIVGTAQSPRISLVSEPQVPDAEKLSWLVLGQGLSGTSGTQIDALQSAAGSLLAQGATAGLQSQLASSLGLDSISFSRSPDNLQQRIVTLGKRLSSRLYLSYRHGLQAAGSVVLLRYTLSPRVTLEAETGVRSVFSLFYNFTFD